MSQNIFFNEQTQKILKKKACAKKISKRGIVTFLVSAGFIASALSTATGLIVADSVQGKDQDNKATEAMVILSGAAFVPFIGGMATFIAGENKYDRATMELDTLVENEKKRKLQETQQSEKTK